MSATVAQPVKSYQSLGLRTGSEEIILPPVITLKGSNNQYASRIQRSTENIEFAKAKVDEHCYFTVHQLSSNKIALKSSNGYWLSRMYRDGSQRIEAAKRDIDEHSQFEVVLGNQNEFYLKANNDQFLSRVLCKHEYLEAAKPIIDSHCLLKIGEPLLKKEILQIQYRLDEADVLDIDPLVAFHTAIINEGTGETTETLNYAYTKSEVGTWNNSAGIEIGVTTTFKAGVPFFAEGEIQVSATTSNSHEWGGSSGTDKEISSSTQVVVPPQTEGKAKILIKRAIINIPFTYKVRRTFLDGKVEEETITTGVYQNVESYFVDVHTYDFHPV